MNNNLKYFEIPTTLSKFNFPLVVNRIKISFKRRNSLKGIHIFGHFSLGFTFTNYSVESTFDTNMIRLIRVYQLEGDNSKGDNKTTNSRKDHIYSVVNPCRCMSELCVYRDSGK
ncbi:unnamed protein product [Heterobilharzia americana]|nr:unnamed protein product [Heterobilharzia americana]